MYSRIKERTYTNLIIIFGLVLLVCGGVFLWADLNRGSGILAGNIKEIGPDFIVISGNLISQSESEIRQNKEVRDFKVFINPDSSFLKTEIQIPKNTGMFKVDDLKKTESISSFQELKSRFLDGRISIGVEVDLGYRFLPWSSFRADEVNYRFGSFGN